MMPVYTVVITGADGHQHVTATDFRDDATAVADLRHIVTGEHFSAALARGAGEDVQFLGVWDWCDGQPRWTAEE